MTDLDVDPVNELDDISPSYPVIVEYTFRHIVWTEAPDQASAVRYTQDLPYEHTNDQTTLQSSRWEVTAPDSWDWSDIYPGWCDGPYDTTADAHVQTHQAEMRRQKLAADQAACTAAGHPNTEPPISDGRIWCKGCTTYLPAPADEKTEATR